HEAEAFLGEVEHFGRAEALARREESRWVLRPGNEAAARCAQMPPGPELAAELVRVAQMPMDDASRITLTACWERMQSWSDAQSMVALSAAAGSPHEASDRWVAADVALSTHLREHAVHARLGYVRRVGDCLPNAWEALNTGRLTSAHVRKLYDVTREADADIAEQVDAAVIPTAIERGWDPSKLRDAARRALLRLDPDGAAERARKARKHSDVNYRPDEDDMAALIARGDAWTTRRMMDEVNRRADAMRRDGDNRPLGELRFNALAQAVLDDVPGIHHDQATVQPAKQAKRRRTPKRAQALVVIDLKSLLGLAEHPGHLDGHGPISADLARRIAADAMLRRLVLDPLTGKPVDLGRNSYRPSRGLRRWIDARDRTCRFPNCRRRAVYCDADHETEW
ncbi:MAG TPA: DUF222 domain-containing protein, partial [Mycobacteriales bacterium]|nr:DUF222 domain-containing protein [Mycobacteriales bacterium]